MADDIVPQLHVLSVLPLRHHAIGASLLQTTTRLSVPIGMAVTTAVWSSVQTREAPGRPEMPYMYAFITTTALSALALALVPFIRIGTLGGDESPGDARRSYWCPDGGAPEIGGKAETRTPGADVTGNRPSRRWSLADAVSRASFWARGGNNTYSLDGNNNIAINKNSSGHHHHHRSNGNNMDNIHNNGSDGSGLSSNSGRKPSTSMPTTACPEGSVVWVVCEDCGTRKKSQSCSSGSGSGAVVGGDPARYFNDPAGAGDVVVGAGCGSGDGATTASTHPGSGTEPGRRRPLPVRRSALTYQILTQGYRI